MAAREDGAATKNHTLVGRPSSILTAMSCKPFAPITLLLLACSLAACGSSARLDGRLGGGPRIPGVTCAPFARELSGVALYGDAADWWDEAAGRYPRTTAPRVGGVLVLRREARLPSGHVSVVSRIVGRREIEVIQANWVPAELDIDQRVVDVSADNDWSAVRIWWPPVGALGAHEYAAYGFIEPHGAATHEELTRAAPVAARLALTAAQGQPPPRAQGYARSYGG